MTEQQARFTSYLLALPVQERRAVTTAAALYAGYSSKTARVQGARLFRHPKVAAALGGESTEVVTANVGTSGNRGVTHFVTETTKPSIKKPYRMVGLCQLPGWEEEEKHERESHRPTGYTFELAEEICYRIATSAKGLKRICDEEESFPSHRTVLRWLTQHEEFCHMYGIAREMQGDYLAFEGLEIIDDSSLDIGFRKDEDGTPFINREVIARSKERVAHRKWLASKLAPRKYGDKLELTSGSRSTNPLADVLREIQEDPTPTIALSKRFKVIEVKGEEAKA